MCQTQMRVASKPWTIAAASGTTDVVMPKHWRNLAHETRDLLTHMADPETKQVLLEIAGSYDRLAELAEKLRV